MEMPSAIRFQTAVLCLWGGYFSGLYSGLTKTSTALPRLSSKRTIL
ncbi:hypothetical protein NEILACOT_04952 [Neisseria lactamica ATCC 23970]|uniref:Uncharacterized protein n=1 Tax=Neisseria lactamica ATCC 23970 TaxID=546265 RepID=D0WBM5_NEILA|nr:hypothetical protein NEILACOT_04952 [Neisseria lactamica ATCC 23970]